jgi:adenine/guanine phosphoribosyltransferase-like PRPP-binding protein
LILVLAILSIDDVLANGSTLSSTC